MQALLRQVITGKQNRTIVAILSPVVQLPLELEKLFVVIEMGMLKKSGMLELHRGQDNFSRSLQTSTSRSRISTRNWSKYWIRPAD